MSIAPHSPEPSPSSPADDGIPEDVKKLALEELETLRGRLLKAFAGIETALATGQHQVAGEAATNARHSLHAARDAMHTVKGLSRSRLLPGSDAALELAGWLVNLLSDELSQDEELSARLARWGFCVEHRQVVDDILRECVQPDGHEPAMAKLQCLKLLAADGGILTPTPAVMSESDLGADGSIHSLSGTVDVAENGPNQGERVSNDFLNSFLETVSVPEPEVSEEPAPSLLPASASTAVPPPAVSPTPPAPPASRPSAFANNDEGVKRDFLPDLIPEVEGYCDEIERFLQQWQEQELAGGEKAGGEDCIKAILRHWHTIKGSANSVHFYSLGAVAHALEELTPDAAQPAPKRRKALVRAVTVIRDTLTEAAANHMEAAFRLNQGLLSELASSFAFSAPEAPTPHVPKQKPAAATEKKAKPRSQSAGGAGVAAAAEAGSQARVDAQSLDALLDYSGELDLAAFRSMETVKKIINTLRPGLTAFTRRLSRAVESFQERYEYDQIINLGEGPAVGTGANPSTRLLDAAGSDAEDRLGLDSYNDVAILSRTFAEISADAAELMRQSDVYLRMLDDDSTVAMKSSGQIRDTIVRIRLEPVAPVLRRLRRVVEESAAAESKDVEFVTDGGDTRMDKAILDRIFDPLLHLVRNSVAHGIEANRDSRVANGKPPRGTVTVRASSTANRVTLEVLDDGAGLNFEAIRAKAEALGYQPPEGGWGDGSTPASAAALLRCIFQTGFSTRAVADSVAGRGIGLDAVLEQVTRLGGNIEAESRPGQGSRFVVKLPTSLAVTKAVFLDIGGQEFALAMPFVDAARGVTRWKATDIKHEEDGRYSLTMGSQSIPIMDLGMRFGSSMLPTAMPAAGTEERQGVIVRVGERRFAVPVNSINGRRSIVVRPLGAFAHNPDQPFFAGAATGADGGVVLVLDVPNLVSIEEGKQVRRAAEESIAARRARERARLLEQDQDRPKILVADDSISVRKAAERLLTDLGYRVELTSDGEPALAAFLANPEAYAAVITDLEMPRVDGYEVLRQVRLSVRPETPVIIVTTRSAQKHRDRAESLGVTDYLIKPYSQEDLKTVLDLCLSPETA